MKKTGIFYGSSTGTTEAVANLIASKLGIASADVHDAGKLTADLAGSYDVLILGTSTWGYGELQDDWNDAVETLKKMDRSGKTVALFGCGDSESYSDTFCDGMGILYEDLKDSQCKFIGFVPDTDYTYNSSVSAVDGHFVGLAIDDVNEGDKTDERVSAWTDEIRGSIARQGRPLRPPVFQPFPGGPGAARPATNTGRRHRYPYGRLHVSQAHHIIAAAGQIHSAVFLLSCHPQQYTYLCTARYAVPSPRLPGSHLRPAAEKPRTQAQPAFPQQADTPAYLPF